MQTWNLNEIEAPRGTPDPSVLVTADGARAVLIVLNPGQELGDHQVKERAWLTVVEGTVEIAGEGGVVTAGAGTLATFAPGEEHSLRSAGGARVLLLLAPWPAADHYQGEERSL